MIRVNLLEGTAEQRVSIQKTKVAARRGQQLFMLAAALVIFAAAIGVDHLWTNNAHARAQEELKVEEEMAKQLEADIKRKNDLENEMKQIEERIKVIEQLRAEQKGPVAILNAINERMPGGTADFKLTGITQKGNTLTIVGTTADERVISSFVKQLEFSNGLFTNLSFSVTGQEVKAGEVETAEKKAEGDGKEKKGEGVENKLEDHMYEFRIACTYNKPRAAGDTQTEQKPQSK
ncbi:MAG TPA: PilN domain-containing protein [Blastocatellia bacterium]|nr:PilN domain-containing protein [Blastocatellia bacterium]